MSELNVAECFEYALELAKVGGEIMREAKDVKTQTKAAEWDWVTEYDMKVEKLIIEGLQKKYPHHKFIAEESSYLMEQAQELTNDPTWIIDPIDGTANFIKSFPFSCISIGFTINKQEELGIVYNPFLEEMFTALKGKGAFLNGKRIFTSKTTDITKSVFNYELTLARVEKLRDMYLRRFEILIGVISGIRSLGSAALGLCYVAKGSTDAYQCDGLMPWDAAAGVLIVREAGGYVCDSSGAEFNLMEPNFIATSTKILADQYLALEREADDKVRNK